MNDLLLNICVSMYPGFCKCPSLRIPMRQGDDFGWERLSVLWPTAHIMIPSKFGNWKFRGDSVDRFRRQFPWGKDMIWVSLQKSHQATGVAMKELGTCRRPLWECRSLFKNLCNTQPAVNYNQIIILFHENFCFSLNECYNPVAMGY